MAINSSQVQTQTQQQVQTLSPQQILAVKLLELPTVELEERIHAELLDNPALEEGKETSGDDLHGEEGEDYATDQDGEPNTDYGEDLSLGDYRTEDDIPDYKLQENNRSKDDKPEDIPFSDSVSFYERRTLLSSYNRDESGFLFHFHTSRGPYAPLHHSYLRQLYSTA